MAVADEFDDLRDDVEADALSSANASTEEISAKRCSEVDGLLRSLVCRTERVLVFGKLWL